MRDLTPHRLHLNMRYPSEIREKDLLSQGSIKEVMKASQ